jgi:hypothetical protein
MKPVTMIMAFGRARIGEHFAVRPADDLFSQAANEVRRARVYAGIHFMTAETQAQTLARKVADWRQADSFQPIA